MNQPYARVNQPYATLTLASALREMSGVQLYKNNARALLSRILSILNLDWLQHTRSVRGVYESYLIIIIIIYCSCKAQHRLQRPQGAQINTNMNTYTYIYIHRAFIKRHFIEITALTLTTKQKY